MNNYYDITENKLTEFNINEEVNSLNIIINGEYVIIDNIIYDYDNNTSDNFFKDKSVIKEFKYINDIFYVLLGKFKYNYINSNRKRGLVC